MNIHQQKGMTILEILIGLSLGIIVLLAAVQSISIIHIQSKYQRAQGISQDSAAFVFHWMEGKSRSLGASTCLNLRSKGVVLSRQRKAHNLIVNRPLDVNTSYGAARTLTEDCRLFDGSGRHYCINMAEKTVYVEEAPAPANNNIQPKQGTDIVTLIYAGDVIGTADQADNMHLLNPAVPFPAELPLNVRGLETFWQGTRTEPKNNYLLISNCDDIELMIFDDAATLNTINNDLNLGGASPLYPSKRIFPDTEGKNSFAIPYLDGSNYKKAFVQRFFIKQYFVGGKGGQYPWRLYEKDLLRSDLPPQPMVSNVKDMQIRVGMEQDSNNDLEWREIGGGAAALNGNDWERVRAMEITVRTGTGDVDEIKVEDGKLNSSMTDFDRSYTRIISIRNN